MQMRLTSILYYWLLSYPEHSTCFIKVDLASVLSLECTKSATRGKKDKPEKTGIKSGHRKSSELDEDVVLDEEDEEDEEEWEPREKKKTKMKSGKRNVSDSDEDFIVDEDEEDEWRPTSQVRYVLDCVLNACFLSRFTKCLLVDAFIPNLIKHSFRSQ